MIHRLRRPAVALASLLFLASPARAEPTSAVDPEVVYRAALDAFKAGNYAEACPKFAEARRLKPDSTPALQGLALCFDKWGKTASAWAKYRQLSVEFKATGDNSRADQANARAEELSKTLSTLVIKPEGSDTPGLMITLDKEEVPRAMLGSKMPVDPGPHVLGATAPGYEVWSTSITVGQKNDAKEIKIPALIAKPPEAKPGAAPTGPSPALRGASYAVGGLGVAGLAVGGIFGGLALSAKSKLADECKTNKICTTKTAQDDRAAAATKATVSTIGISVGGAALAAGIVLFAVSGRAAAPAEQPRVGFVPAFGPEGGSFTFVGSF
jgi:hypothetical protein